MRRLFIIMVLFFSLTNNYQFLCAQDDDNQVIAGRIYADYIHTNHVSWGNSNDYSFDLSIIYGRIQDKNLLPLIRRIEVLTNQLSPNPYLIGIKVDFAPRFSFTEVFVRKYYSIRCNPFFRIYSTYNIFLETGLGLNFEWWTIYEPNPQGNSIYIPKAKTINYFIEGGIGYKIKLSDKVSLEPVILYRYLDDIKSNEKYGIIDAGNKNKGLFPYISLNYYF